jgi:teichoic acid transport system permease protein
MIRAFSFPRAALPITAEIRDALQMGYTFAVILVMIMLIPPIQGPGDDWFLPGEKPELTWFLVIPIFVLQFLLNMGISFFMARLGFVLPDISQTMTVVGRLLMYSSGVIFPIDRYLTNPAVAAIIQANPIYRLIQMYRQVLIDGTVPPPEAWAVLGLWSVGLLLFGFVYFWRGEATYGDER